MHISAIITFGKLIGYQEFSCTIVGITNKWLKIIMDGDKDVTAIKISHIKKIEFEEE